jgi:hypothetical protein
MLRGWQAGVVDLKLPPLSRPLPWELNFKSRTKIMKLPVSLLFRRSYRRVPQARLFRVGAELTTIHPQPHAVDKSCRHPSVAAFG